MRLVRILRAAGAELVSLIVEDWVTFAGGVFALLFMYVLGREVHSMRRAAGFLAFAIVWAALAVSFARAAREVRPEHDDDRREVASS